MNFNIWTAKISVAFKIIVVVFITFSAFCSTTDDAIWIIRLFGQPLKWKQKI
jgi:hypothetical protein